MLVLLDAMFITERRRLAALEVAARMPTIAGERDLVEAGGLVSYGIDLSDNWRRAAYLVDRDFGRARPAELPVESRVRYVLVINLKTAAVMGLSMAPRFLPKLTS